MKRMTWHFCVLSLAAFFFLVGTSLRAEDDSNVVSSKPNSVAGAAQDDSSTVTQAEVLRKIHLINQLEIKAGEMAKQKAQSPKVRRYAERLIKDHRRADRKVQQTAKSEGLNILVPIASVDQKIGDKKQALMQKLETAQGGTFDRVFAKEMDSAHEDAIDSLKNDREKLKGTKTAGLITSLLPGLEKHERIAEKIEKAE